MMKKKKDGYILFFLYSPIVLGSYWLLNLYTVGNNLRKLLQLKDFTNFLLHFKGATFLSSNLIKCGGVHMSPFI